MDNIWIAGPGLTIILVSLIGWFWFEPDLFREAWNPNGLKTSDAIAQSIPLTLWAFLGMESAAVTSISTRKPGVASAATCNHSGKIQIGT